MKNKKIRKQKTICIFSIIICLLVAVLLTYKLVKQLTPLYKIEDRVKKVEEYKGNALEKAVGWLRVQGTNIDFPIVNYDDTDVTDPTYDLGWTDLEYNDFPKRITIFSHNVLNVSSNPLITNPNHKRFEQLMSFIYTDFVKKNKYIQYTSNGHNYLYKIYSISFKNEEDMEYKNISNEKYIKDAIKNSYFKFNTDVNKNDKLLTLVTCTRFFGATTEYSFVVDARRVRKNERIKNYDISEKMSYNRIKKIMEGVEEDEKI